MLTTEFGIAAPELMPGARNAIEVCLAVKPYERVALITDRPSLPVTASLAAALAENQAEFEPYVLEGYASRPLTKAPAEVMKALEEAESAILCMQPMEGELGARRDIVGVVERRHIRYAHMVGVTPLIMQQGMRADYHAIDRLSERLRQRMARAETLRVETRAGTAFTAHFSSDRDWVKTSGLINPLYWSNLPAGEVFTAPVTVDGTFVCDGTAGDHFNAKYGDLQETPLVLAIRGGCLVEADSSRKDLAQEFWAYCHTDENSNRVGELAFGTNLNLVEFIGVLLQDEKFPGVHLAFGDPYGSQTHANWYSKTHVDVLTRGCNVWIDNDQVMNSGHYLMRRLGL